MEITKVKSFLTYSIDRQCRFLKQGRSNNIMEFKCKFILLYYTRYKIMFIAQFLNGK